LIALEFESAVLFLVGDRFFFFGVLMSALAVVVVGNKYVCFLAMAYL
jgi:hypothetical protein